MKFSKLIIFFINYKKNINLSYENYESKTLTSKYLTLMYLKSSGEKIKSSAKDKENVKMVREINFDELSNLKILNIEKKNFFTIESNAFNVFKSVQCLDLSNRRLRELKESNFKGLDNLEYLDIGSNEFNLIDNYAFRDLPKLNNLVVSNKSSKSFNIMQPKTLNNLKNLSTLILENLNLKALKNNFFIDLINLKSLYATNNKIETIEDEAFMGLKNLQMLDLSSNLIKEPNLKSFNHLPSLTRLFLNNNLITMFTTKKYNNEFLKNLKILNLSKNCLIDVDFNETIFNNLEFLYLSDNEKHISAMNLNDFKCLKNFNQLNLSMKFENEMKNEK